MRRIAKFIKETRSRLYYNQPVYIPGYEYSPWKRWAVISAIALVISLIIAGYLNHNIRVENSRIVISPDQSSAQTLSQKDAKPTPAAVELAAGKLNTIGARTKTSGCVINGSLQDKACSPGAIFSATAAQVCVPGYSSSVRNVPESTKNAVYAEYGIASHTTGQYEVDHLIPLELGGSNDIANLWPEPANPTPGFHQKDMIENSLHSKVCSGDMSLATAQLEIADNWLSVYNGNNVTSSQASQPQVALAPAPASSGEVKKSSTGICHAPGTTYYDRTTNFTPYSTLDACLAAGGRLPLK